MPLNAARWEAGRSAFCRRIRVGPVIPGVDPEPADPVPPGPDPAPGRGCRPQTACCDAKTCWARRGCSGSSHRQAPHRPSLPGGSTGRRLDALPGEDLVLPVKRQVIAVFGDLDVGEQGGGSEAFGDRPFWRRRLMNGHAGPAAHSGTRIPVTRSRAGTLSSISLTVSPIRCSARTARQARLSNRTSSRGRCAGRLGRSSCALAVLDLAWKYGFGPCEMGVVILEAELQLIVIEPLRTPAELAALQLLDDDVKALGVGLRPAEPGALAASERTSFCSASASSGSAEDRCS